MWQVVCWICRYRYLFVTHSLILTNPSASQVCKALRRMNIANHVTFVGGIVPRH